MRIRKEQIVIPSLPESLAGYSILHVSDIHFDGSVERNRTLRQWLRSNDADLMLITGDFITHDSVIDSLAKYIEDSRARDGIFGILGNHDYYYRTLWQHFRHRILGKDYLSNDWTRLVDRLRGLGIRVLINEHVLIETAKGGTIFLEGTDDPVTGKPEIADAGPEYQSSGLKILMSHSPDILYSSEIGRKRFDLLFSGHTHGGQVRIPGIGPIFTGMDRGKRSDAYGLYRKENGMFVSVSAGIGYSLLPLRFNCPPEITLVRLARAN